MSESEQWDAERYEQEFDPAVMDGGRREQGLRDLIERLERAEVELDAMANAAAAEDETHTAMAVRMIRLAGKVEGVKLALSYAREYER